MLRGAQDPHGVSSPFLPLPSGPSTHSQPSWWTQSLLTGSTWPEFPSSSGAPFGSSKAPGRAGRASRQGSLPASGVGRGAVGRDPHPVDVVRKGQSGSHAGYESTAWEHLGRELWWCSPKDIIPPAWVQACALAGFCLLGKVMPPAGCLGGSSLPELGLCEIPLLSLLCWFGGGSVCRCSGLSLTLPQFVIKNEIFGLSA